MKPLAVLLLLGTAMAQSVGLRQVDPQPMQMASHPQTATVQVLSYGGEITVASGEQASGFPAPPPKESLGDAARRLRAEHANDPQSGVVWIN